MSDAFMAINTGFSLIQPVGVLVNRATSLLGKVHEFEIVSVVTLV